MVGMVFHMGDENHGFGIFGDTGKVFEYFRYAKSHDSLELIDGAGHSGTGENQDIVFIRMDVIFDCGTGLPVGFRHDTSGEGVFRVGVCHIRSEYLA